MLIIWIFNLKRFDNSFKLPTFKLNMQILIDEKTAQTALASLFTSLSMNIWDEDVIRAAEKLQNAINFAKFSSIDSMLEKPVSEDIGPKILAMAQIGPEEHFCLDVSFEQTTGLELA